MLTKRHGKAAIKKYHHQHEQTQAEADRYNQAFLKGDYQTIYRFGKHLINENDIGIDAKQIKLPELDKAIDLELENPFKDMI